MSGITRSIFRPIQRGILAVTPIPIPVSWTVLADGVTLRGVFTQPITAGSLTGLAASVVTLSSGAVVGGNFDITVPVVYQGADAGTITYSGSGTLAGAGGLVAAFGPTAIVNDSTQVAPTLATFDPTKLGATGQLSNGNLTLSDSATGAWATCLVTIGRTTGKGSVEFTFGTSVNFYVMVGAATASVGLNSFVGADTLGYGDFGAAGVLYHDSSSVAGTAFGDTDVVTVGYDFDAKTMKVSVNGGTPDTYSISALSGAIFAAASVYTESGPGNSTHIDLNAGQTAFTYPIAGYPEGL